MVVQRISNSLCNNANQFGFKDDPSTDMAIFLLKQTIAHYNKHGSPVYAAFLNASKAFDGVNHSLLIHKIIKLGVPMCFVHIIECWYRKQHVQIR